MEESPLKERSAVIRVQVPLAIGAFLLNEKRSDLAEMKNTPRPTLSLFQTRICKRRTIW